MCATSSKSQQRPQGGFISPRDKRRLAAKRERAVQRRAHEAVLNRLAERRAFIATAIHQSTSLAGLPAEIQHDVLRRLSDHATAIYLAEGPAAFEAPREAAALHEAGHAVVGAHEGFSIEKLTISEKIQNGASLWGGFTHSQPWSVKQTTQPADDLRHARFIIAGLAAESMTEWNRAGSSLDELILAQLVTALAAQKVGADEQILWRNDVWAGSAKIIKHNAEPFNQIVDHLLHTQEISGGDLQAMLSAVRQISAAETAR